MKHKLFFDILSNTAWRMDKPALFGAFHITAALLAVTAAAAAAVLFARRIRSAEDSKRYLGRVLFVSGIILAALEIYKQLFLFHIVNGRVYDWWFFPFQLCSVPMYLCILFPLARGKLRSTILTFLSSYTLISAAAALIYPDDMLRAYISLTIHGFVWHGMILFISLLVIISEEADSSAGSLLRAAAMFAVFCMAAVCFNAEVEPVMQSIHSVHPEIPHSWAAMFYMNPYHISPQPLVDGIQKAAGIPAGLVLYAAVIACFSSLICKLSCRERRSP